MTKLMDKSTSPVDVIGDFLLEVKKGNIGDHSCIQIFGENAAVGSTETDIWYAGGRLTWLSSAATMNVVSANTSDSATGTGAREVKILGHDNNFDLISTTVTLNGTTAVATVGAFRRVYRAFVTKGGSTGLFNHNPTNIGDITISDSASAHVQAKIEAGTGQTNQAQFTVPRGKTGYIDRLALTMDGGKAVDINMILRRRADITAVPVVPQRSERHWLGLQTPVVDDMGTGAIPEMTDVWFTGKYGGGGTAAIDVEYKLIMEDNT